jgi:hypothetical protein
LDGRLDVRSFNDSYLKRVRKFERMRRKDERERPFRERKVGKDRATLEREVAENLGKYQKDALRHLVSWVIYHSSDKEEYKLAMAAIKDGFIALDGDDPEVLEAVQYFIWVFDALAPWFKQHSHKRRERGEKPTLTVV